MKVRVFAKRDSSAVSLAPSGLKFAVDVVPTKEPFVLVYDACAKLPEALTEGRSCGIHSMASSHRNVERTRKGCCVRRGCFESTPGKSGITFIHLDH